MKSCKHKKAPTEISVGVIFRNYYNANCNTQKAAYIPRSEMPCQRESFCFIRVGTVKISITTSITGISIINEELIPLIKPDTGTAKGLIVIAAPLTRTRLKRLAPIMLPSESEP